MYDGISVSSRKYPQLDPQCAMIKHKNGVDVIISYHGMATCSVFDVPGIDRINSLSSGEISGHWAGELLPYKCHANAHTNETLPDM